MKQPNLSACTAVTLPRGVHAGMETDSYWRALAARDDGPSALARWACRLNAVALIVEVACVAAREVPPSAAATQTLTVVAIISFLVVVCGVYAMSAGMGALPGFTSDDYRLSAAMDFCPATEIATIGIALALANLIAIAPLLAPAALQL